VFGDYAHGGLAQHAHHAQCPMPNAHWPKSLAQCPKVLPKSLAQYAQCPKAMPKSLAQYAQCPKVMPKNRIGHNFWAKHF
jgi:hypothetical protein